MRKALILAATVLLCCTAQPAMALDSLDGFRLDAKTIEPYDMSCKVFMAGSDNLQILVAAWWDGDCTTTDLRRIEYSPTDVADMRQNLIDGCEDDPKATLDEIGFNYGGKEDDYERARCSLYLDMKTPAQAAAYLGWAIGRLAEDMDAYKIDRDEFIALGNKLFTLCQEDTRANFVELVQANMSRSRSASGSGKDIDN